MGSPSANILCRWCEIVRPDVRNHSTTDTAVLRMTNSITEAGRYAEDHALLGDSRICQGNMSFEFKLFFYIGRNIILDAMHNMPEFGRILRQTLKHK